MHAQESLGGPETRPATWLYLTPPVIARRRYWTGSPRPSRCRARRCSATRRRGTPPSRRTCACSRACSSWRPSPSTSMALLSGAAPLPVLSMDACWVLPPTRLGRAGASDHTTVVDYIRIVIGVCCLRCGVPSMPLLTPRSGLLSSRFLLSIERPREHCILQNLTFTPVCVLASSMCDSTRLLIASTVAPQRKQKFACMGNPVEAVTAAAAPETLCGSAKGTWGLRT